MIAEFPQFKPLRLSDRAAVQHLTRRFPPYSDFNFTSLWSWDITEAVRISALNNNLVVRFTDYVTDEPFYSFLGDNNVDDTATQILRLARSEGLKPELRLLPEASAWHLTPGGFVMEPDEDNFDYVLSVDRLKSYQGNKLGPKRNFVNRFNKSHNAITVPVDLCDESIQERFLNLFHRWTAQKGPAASNADNELIALHRLVFAARDIPNLFTVATFVRDELAGFSINEILSNGYSIIHFEKADAVKYVGIYAHLMQQMAWILADKGCHYINYEQDLGIVGLRKGKSSYIPADYLRKYVLRPATASIQPESEATSVDPSPFFLLTGSERALQGLGSLRLPALSPEAWESPEEGNVAPPAPEPRPAPAVEEPDLRALGQISLRLPPLVQERWLGAELSEGVLEEPAPTSTRASELPPYSERVGFVGHGREESSAPRSELPPHSQSPARWPMPRERAPLSEHYPLSEPYPRSERQSYGDLYEPLELSELAGEHDTRGRAELAPPSKRNPPRVISGPGRAPNKNDPDQE